MKTKERTIWICNTLTSGRGKILSSQTFDPVADSP